jgi:hypothetical protein
MPAFSGLRFASRGTSTVGEKLGKKKKRYHHDKDELLDP